MAELGPRTMVLLASAARTANGQGGVIVPIGRFTAAKIWLNVTAASGTSETLNVFIQDAMRDIQAGAVEGDATTGAYIYDDYGAFDQMTAVGTDYIRTVGGGNVVHTGSDAALSAGTVRNGPIGDVWRIKWTTGGTNESFTFYVLAQLIP